MARRRRKAKTSYTVRRKSRTVSRHSKLGVALRRAKRLAVSSQRNTFVAKQVGRQRKIIARCTPRGRGCERKDGMVF